MEGREWCNLGAVSFGLVGPAQRYKVVLYDIWTMGCSLASMSEHGPICPHAAFVSFVDSQTVFIMHAHTCTRMPPASGRPKATVGRKTLRVCRSNKKWPGSSLLPIFHPALRRTWTRRSAVAMTLCKKVNISNTSTNRSWSMDIV